MPAPSTRRRTRSLAGALLQARTRRGTRSLAGALLDAQEAERRRVARELHDEIGGALTAVQTTLALARDAARSADARRRCDDGIAALGRVLAGIRRLSLDLHPPALEDLGLAAALRSHATAQAARAGLALALDLAADDVPAALALPCYRIAQEAITNVLRHARARRLAVTLACEGRAIALTVEDDGAGFDRARARITDSLGLRGMAERAALAGGRVEIDSARGRGTRVHAVFPLPRSSPTGAGTRSSSRRRGGRTRRRSP